MPNFIVCPATSEDVEAVAKINYAAFYSSDVGFQVIFPKGATEESVRYTAAQMKHDLEQNKNSNLMVVKDAVTGEIAAWATWHFLPSRAPEEIEKEMLMDQFPLPADANIAAGNRLIHDGMRKHHELIAKYYGIGAPHAYLEALGTSPNFQKQGAGSLLVAWGCAQADEKHLPAYLQATSMGRRLYERHGFVEIDQLKLEMSPWKDGDFYHICMLRPAKP